MKRTLTLLALSAPAFAQGISHTAPPAGAVAPVQVPAYSFSGASCTDCAFIDFEGMADNQPVGTIPGQPSVTFGPAWFSLIDSDAGGGGNFANEPSADTIAYFTAANEPITFSLGVSFVEVAYVASASSIPVTMNAYDGPDGTGNLVASTNGNTVGNSSDGAACTGDPGGSFCLWDYMSINTGVNNIRSIVLVGAVANNFGFDDMTFCRQIDAGTNYCGPAVPNSTGNPANISALGSDVTTDNCLVLGAHGIPADQFCYFLNSPSQGFVQNPGGSLGNLCLTGGIGRHTAQAGNAGSDGTYTISVDLTALPRPTGQPPITTVMPGETWNFQNWYRDGNDSNFTDAVSVTFN